MLHWKNKPIDQLSKAELVAALTESVSLVLSRTDHGADQNDGSQVLPTFVAGIAVGAVIFMLGSFIVTLG